MNIKIYFILILSVAAVSCIPNSGDSLEVVMSDLIGLWNSSEKEGAKTDVIYTRVTSGGAIIEYDFDGDEIDQGLNCYQIESGSVKALTTNRFLVTTDMHDNKQFEIELELLDNGQALKIYFMDKEDPRKALRSQIWTRESDASILDKEPSCKTL